MHTREELKNKKIVKSVVNQVTREKPMRNQVKELVSSHEYQEILNEPRFIHRKLDPNPFPRTQQEWGLP